MGIGATKHKRTDSESHRIHQKHGFHDATARTRDFYETTKGRNAIIRNNRGYLLEKIQTHDGVTVSLSLGKCITAEQYLLLEHHRTQQIKKTELLHAMWSIDDKKFPEFLRGIIGQKTVTRIIRNGGVVIKGIVKNYGETRAMFVDPHLLYQRMNDIQNRNNNRADETDHVASQLNEEDIEIVNTQLDGRTVIVWIWCRSQEALKNIQMLYESNQLADVLFGFQNNRQSASELTKSNVISIDSNEFRKTVVVFPISKDFTGKRGIRRGEDQKGVTLLGKEICVLSELFFYVADSFSVSVIRVFEDRSPFRLKNQIEIKAIKSPADIGSSEKDNCLYVSDFEENWVWKIIKETNDQYKIILWLTTDFQPRTLSVSSNGDLLMADYSSSILNIYGSDAKLIRSIHLPEDIRNPRHAVETSAGSFIILSERVEKNSRRYCFCWCVVNELSRDGQTVIRRFNPSNETNHRYYANYLSLDSGGRVFLAAKKSHRVILLDPDLKWNRILYPREAGDKVESPRRLYYHERLEQLFVVGHPGKVARRNRAKSSNEAKSGLPYWHEKNDHPKISILCKGRSRRVFRKTSGFKF